MKYLKTPRGIAAGSTALLLLFWMVNDPVSFFSVIIFLLIFLVIVYLGFAITSNDWNWMKKLIQEMKSYT